MMNESGLLIVFSGPSGAGKDTILKGLLEKEQQIRLSVSATTRSPRLGEEDGVDYFFLSKEEFSSRIEQDQMLEYAEYCGNYYGTPRAPIEKWNAEGNDVILEIEVQGGSQIKKKCPSCVSIFVLPPSLKELEKRLRLRNTEDEITIQKRLKAAQEEILKAKDYDYVIVNDTIENAIEQIITVIAAEKCRYVRSKSTIERVLGNA